MWEGMGEEGDGCSGVARNVELVGHYRGMAAYRGV